MVGKDELTVQLEEWKDVWKKNTEELVLKTFPAKIMEIDSLTHDSRFQLNRLPDIAVKLNIPVPEFIMLGDNEVTSNNCVKKVETNYPKVEGTKVMAFVNGVVPSNKHIIEMTEIVKPVVREAVESVNRVKMWILFLIPRIEDGNNFGVSIQEDTLSEVRSVEAEAASFLDQISRYLIARGKLVSKVAKYPHVEDYRRAIVDLDEKEFINLRLVLMEVRNHYSTLHDMIIKNLEKIKKPRTSTMEHLY